MATTVLLLSPTLLIAERYTGGGKGAPPSINRGKRLVDAANISLL